MLKAICDIKDPDSFSKIEPINSKFFCLKDGEFFDVKMQYPILNIKSAVKECYVREEVFERLKIAQNNLPHGLKLCILDAWRPFALQEELYQIYSKQIITQFNLKDSPLEVKQKVIAKYVSTPVKDKLEPAVHTTGGAVDVTLICADGTPLDMGTTFDAFSEKTKTNYYETHQENTIIRNNRRILYNSMISAGFTNLPSEWWHYDFGNKFWGYYTDTPAFYSGVFDVNELSKFLNLTD